VRLLSLRLRNFRQHADSSMEFHPGLTGIIGPNGAGKSTILEALSWAIYGSQAARGTNDTIRFTRAGTRARVEVELRFALGGHEYRVSRTLSQAEVWLDGGSSPVATGLGGVSQYLQRRLGMSREEFFNTYFTGQKELQFLAAMGPAERGRFLGQVLGYERLRGAQDLVRARRSELRSEIRGVRAALGDAESIAAAVSATATRQAASALAAAESARVVEEASAAVARIEPRWARAQAARERFRELSHRVERAERAGEAATREADRAGRELAAAAAAEAELAPLRERLAELPGAADHCAGLAALAMQHERRVGLERQIAASDAELLRLRERLAKVEGSPALERRYSAELEASRAARRELEEALDERKSAWLRDRQDAATKLQGFRDRGKELREQIRQIERLGPEGACPTCGRPVGEDYGRLLEQLHDGWQEIVQDGTWWSSRSEQLEAKPEEVAGLEAGVAGLGEQVDDRARKLARCQAAVAEREQLLEDLAVQGASVERLREELALLPAGYDAGEHRAAQARLEELRELEKRAARLEESASRRPGEERARMEALDGVARAAEESAAAAAERAALDFSEESFEAARVEHAAAGAALRSGELAAADARGMLHAAEEAAGAARAAHEEHEARLRTIEAQESELRYHDELDVAYSHLRQELNDAVRPELSEIASAFLAQLTDGRYTSMEIDGSYNLMVLDEGEEKPVISGGEEDIANLVLRLSLSQMIAERAGHPLSLLVLDEVFGSLDVARRDNVVQLLHRLEDRFEQVVLITHVEGIRESLDRVLRVTYDERNGCSTVVEEDLPPGGERPEAPLAAD
jgi:DNA repair protein SbcC/Rad50